MKLSFIIPVLNEAEQLESLVTQVKTLLLENVEVIVVDGVSHDGTLEAIKEIGCQVISSPAGRAKQMNAGAKIAKGDVLVFLHADTCLPNSVIKNITTVIHMHPWGRFNVSLSGKSYIFRIIEALMNIRSCISGIATGDQCIFVTKILFEKIGGYSDIPLMEDIAISKRLKRTSMPACIKERVTTSSRRWESKGILRTIVLMWFLRLAYFVGVSPHRLQQLYYK